MPETTHPDLTPLTAHRAAVHVDDPLSTTSTITLVCDGCEAVLVEGVEVIELAKLIDAEKAHRLEVRRTLYGGNDGD